MSKPVIMACLVSAITFLGENDGFCNDLARWVQYVVLCVSCEILKLLLQFAFCLTIKSL